MTTPACVSPSIALTDVCPLDSGDVVIAPPTTTAEAFARLKADTDGSVLAGAMGRTMTWRHLVMLTDADGGADQIGTGHLDVVNNAAPSYQVDNPTLGGIDTLDPNLTSDGVQADNGTDWDVGAESSALLYIGTFSAAPTSLRIMFSKGVGTGGFNLRAHTGNGLRCWFIGAADSKNVTAAFNFFDGGTDHEDLIIALIPNDRTADTFQMFTNRGNSAAVTAVTATMTHANTAKIGFAPGLGSGEPSQRPALLAQAVGSNAEGFTAAHVSNLQTWLVLDEGLG